MKTKKKQDFIELDLKKLVIEDIEFLKRGDLVFIYDDEYNSLTVGKFIEIKTGFISRNTYLIIKDFDNSKNQYNIDYFSFYKSNGYQKVKK